MKVSFDFDAVLTDERYRVLAAKFLNEGNEVIIVTTRFEKDGAAIIDLAQIIGIENIIFTEGRPKHEVFKHLENIDLHFDDDALEIELMNEYECKTIGVVI